MNGNPDSATAPVCRFRWQLIPATLNWAIATLFLSGIPFIACRHWSQLRVFPESANTPSVIWFCVTFAVAVLLLVAGWKWFQGKWRTALFLDAVFWIAGMSFDSYQQSAIKQGASTVSSIRSNQGDQQATPLPQDRLSYQESCRALQQLGHLGDGEIPPLPDRRPQYGDDQPLGLNFFRTLLSGSAIENMQIPRTYIGRSEVGPISFRNSNLSESTLCWNDFKDVDFTNADLSKSDLRASLFQNVNFGSANLSNCDLRRSSFENCNFRSSKLAGAKMTRPQVRAVILSTVQVQEIDWQEEDGEEPDGG